MSILVVIPGRRPNAPARHMSVEVEVEKGSGRRDDNAR